MTISINQQVDFLWKKIGFGVAKTDIPSKKDATNESIPSSLIIAGNKIWADSHLIPAVIPSLSSSTVFIHSQSLNNVVECVMDITCTPNRTWLTNIKDWIPVEFGSTYQIKVYLDTAGSTTPTTTGIQLYAAGNNDDDEWYFDYEAGVLHFIGLNLPAQTWTGKHIFITGARYTGVKGLNNTASSTIGNLTITGSTISSTDDIILDPAGTSGNVSVSGAIITNAGYPAAPTDVATYQFVTDQILALHPNTIFQGDSILRLSDPTGNAGVLTAAIDGTLMLSMTSTNTTVGQISFANNIISSLADIEISPIAGKVVTTSSTTAWKIPTGPTSDRPVVPQTGYLRFNTTLGGIECFNGTDWVGSQTQIASQVIVGDGISDTFNLDQATYENNIIVTIQGVTQVPGVSYSVTGNTITFSEIPKDEERIEVRFISQSVTPIVPPSQLAETSIVTTDSIIVGTNNVVLDSFPISLYQSAKYMLSVVANDGNTQLTEILVSHNDVTAVFFKTSTDMTSTSTTVVTYVAQISYGACELLAISTTPNTQIKVQKIYFAK